jgi:hypothetical protein
MLLFAWFCIGLHVRFGWFESPILRKRNDRLLGGLFVCWGYVVWDSNVRWGPIGVAQRRLWGPFSAVKKPQNALGLFSFEPLFSQEAGDRLDSFQHLVYDKNQH